MKPVNVHVYQTDNSPFSGWAVFKDADNLSLWQALIAVFPAWNEDEARAFAKTIDNATVGQVGGKVEFMFAATVESDK